MTKCELLIQVLQWSLLKQKSLEQLFLRTYSISPYYHGCVPEGIWPRSSPSSSCGPQSQKTSTSTSKVYEIQECSAHGRTPAASAYANQIDTQMYKGINDLFSKASKIHIFLRKFSVSMHIFMLTHLVLARGVSWDSSWYTSEWIRKRWLLGFRLDLGAARI